VGWDGYGASPPAEKAINNALHFLRILRLCDVFPSRSMPSVVGGVGLSFRQENRKAYFEFYNDGKACVLLSDGIGEPEATDVETTGIGFLSVIDQAREYLNVRPPARYAPK
jgi:hypothetical protein